MIRVLGRCAFALLLFATASLVAPARGGEDVLQIGDIVTLHLAGEAAINKDYQIDRRGAILLPEVGATPIAGKTLAAATDAVRKALSLAYRDLSQLTMVLKERKLLISVHGYVRTPGPVELPGDATIQMALMAAGGMLQGAQLDRMRVTRADGKVIQFDFKNYLDTGDESLLPDLRPLDAIFVPASPLTGKVQIEFDGRTLAAAGDGGEAAKSVKVFGEVAAPATFAWKEGGTVLDLLMRAGGVTRYASVDQIRILNKDGPIVFNLQAYLDTGDGRLLPKVDPGATIFVPKQMEEVRRGALTVYVMGEVARPGALDAKKDSTFIDILANAGGPTRFADTRHIRIIRSDGAITHVDLPQFTERGGDLPPVRPGDTIFVPEKTQASEGSWLRVAPGSAVQLLGAVMKPGRYEWSDEMSLFDLIAAAGGPAARSDLAHVQILKKGAAGSKPIVFDMAAFISGGGKAETVPRITAGDLIMVPELPIDPNDNRSQWTKQAPEQSIYLFGQIATPGRYAFNDKLGFLDIITAANGPTPAADLRNIRVTKRGLKGSKVITVDLERYFRTGDEKLLPRVRTGDVIYLPDRVTDLSKARSNEVVRLMGAVGRPGRYPFNDSQTLLDLLAEAGGPTGDAMQDKIVVVQMAGRQRQVRVFDLASFVRTGDIERVPLVRAGDLVYVPRQTEDAWRRALNDIREGASMLSIYALVNAMLMK